MIRISSGEAPGTEDAHFTPCPVLGAHQGAIFSLLSIVTVNLYEVLGFVRAHTSFRTLAPS